MKKRFIIAIVLTVLAVFSAGCTASPDDSTESQTRVFTDSAGREVIIPQDLGAVAPTGPLSQTILFMACPDHLVGISVDFPEESAGYIPDRYRHLPKFGQFYGKNVSMNLEALVLAAPDVIVDIGEAKENIVSDMDELQQQLGIPVVFIEATLDTMEETFLLLGELTGDKHRSERLAAYCKSAIEQADAIRGSIGVEDMVSVYIAMGENGLSTNARYSFHADVPQRVGAVNVADVEASALGGGSLVSFEQVMLWNPQVILVDSVKLYEALNSDPLWRQVEAVRTGKVYKIPSIPYNFMTNPPAANRILGVKWLGALLYPELYGADLEDQVRSFFEEFYSIELTDEQYREVMLYSSDQ